MYESVRCTRVKEGMRVGKSESERVYESARCTKVKEGMRMSKGRARECMSPGGVQG